MASNTWWLDGIFQNVWKDNAKYLDTQSWYTSMEYQYIKFNQVLLASLMQVLEIYEHTQLHTTYQRA